MDGLELRFSCAGPGKLPPVEMTTLKIALALQERGWKKYIVFGISK
jgi:hypothetical protein